MDILLNGDTKDAVFLNGQCPVTDEARQSTAQRLTIKLRTFQGEWFVDEEYGIPYIGKIMGRGRKKSSIDTIFQQAILEEPYIASIASFTSDIDAATRTYSAVFTAITNMGETTEPITINLGL
jgi:hypothetical protein